VPQVNGLHHPLRTSRRLIRPDSCLPIVRRRPVSRRLKIYLQEGFNPNQRSAAFTILFTARFTLTHYLASNSRGRYIPVQLEFSLATTARRLRPIRREEARWSRESDPWLWSRCQLHPASSGRLRRYWTKVPFRAAEEIGIMRSGEISFTEVGGILVRCTSGRVATFSGVGAKGHPADRKAW
jgi:hypothetical protein